MKTREEIQEFFKGKSYIQSRGLFIAGFIRGKGLNPIEVPASIFGNNTTTSFLEWFESEPKEEEQDTITFKGKEYEFIESTQGICCRNCDLIELGNCTLFPVICSSGNRRDRKQGYFKLIKPKELELIPNEFYTCNCLGYTYVFLKDNILNNNTLWWMTSFIYALRINDDVFLEKNRIGICPTKLKKASEEAKNVLIKEIKKRTGKIWNEQTKSFEDKPKDILVPESIKIGRYNGNLLSLFFNNNKQYLMFSLKQQTYIVQSADGYEKAFKCKLIPFKYEELQAGDIFFDGDIDSKENFANLENYILKIGENKNLFAHKDEIRSVFYTEEPIVYKLIPLN